MRSCQALQVSRQTSKASLRATRPRGAYLAYRPLNLDKLTPEFEEMVDALCLAADKDTELASGLRWIDEQARRQQVSFYEMALITVRNHMANKKAKAWLAGKKETQVS